VYKGVTCNGNSAIRDWIEGRRIKEPTCHAILSLVVNLNLGCDANEEEEEGEEELI
jgi:hypothetical protein